MERWGGRIALVTGGAFGIGKSICRKLVQQGMTVIGCDKNPTCVERMREAEQKMKALPGVLHPIKCDLTKESEILDMFTEIRKKFGRLHVCINNAGFTTNAWLTTGKTEEWREMLEVNVLALCIVNREAIKLMREKEVEEAQIIQIGSSYGLQKPNHLSMPGTNFYFGTASMVRTLTEGLTEEVKSENNEKCFIRVSSISPGFTESEFLGNIYNPILARSMPGYNHRIGPKFYEGMECIKPDDVADAVTFILQSPPKVNVNDVLVIPAERKNPQKK